MPYPFTTLRHASLLLLTLFALSPASADTMKQEGSKAMMKESQMDSSSHQPGMKEMHKGMTQNDGQMMQETMDQPEMNSMEDTAKKPMKKPMH